MSKEPSRKNKDIFEQMFQTKVVSYKELFLHLNLYSISNAFFEWLYGLKTQLACVARVRIQPFFYVLRNNFPPYCLRYVTIYSWIKGQTTGNGLVRWFYHLNLVHNINILECYNLAPKVIIPSYISYTHGTIICAVLQSFIKMIPVIKWRCHIIALTEEIGDVLFA